MKVWKRAYLSPLPLGAAISEVQSVVQLPAAVMLLGSGATHSGVVGVGSGSGGSVSDTGVERRVSVNVPVLPAW